jgi:hypothetical protein
MRSALPAASVGHPSGHRQFPTSVGFWSCRPVRQLEKSALVGKLRNVTECEIHASSCKRREIARRRAEPGWRGSDSLSERSEQWIRCEGVLSSASDDEVGGLHARLREQLQIKAARLCQDVRSVAGRPPQRDCPALPYGFPSNRAARVRHALPKARLQNRSSAQRASAAWRS